MFPFLLSAGSTADKDGEDYYVIASPVGWVIVNKYRTIVTEEG